MPSLGGPIITAGGVAFLTSTSDYYIRAYDVTTGKVLWEDRLPAGGQSTPMTYEANARQYVVTVDGGHGSFGTREGDYIVAYAFLRARADNGCGGVGWVSLAVPCGIGDRAWNVERTLPPDMLPLRLAQALPCWAGWSPGRAEG